MGWGRWRCMELYGTVRMVNEYINTQGLPSTFNHTEVARPARRMCMGCPTWHHVAMLVMVSVATTVMPHRDQSAVVVQWL